MLYEADCLHILPTLDTHSIDAVITDLPFGTTACKWDEVIPFEPLWSELTRVIKPNGAIVLFGAQPFTSKLVMSNPKWFKYAWVWNKVNRKTGFLNAKKAPLKVHEDICVFYKKHPTYNPQMTHDGTPYNVTHPNINNSTVYGKQYYRPTSTNNGSRYPLDILNIEALVRSEGNIHPTQKPVELLEYLVKTYTNEGETVLDCTMGSGTTGVACKNLNRQFIGIEKDATYFQIAQSRLSS